MEQMPQLFSIYTATSVFTTDYCPYKRVSVPIFIYSHAELDSRTVRETPFPQMVLVLLEMEM